MNNSVYWNQFSFVIMILIYLLTLYLFALSIITGTNEEEGLSVKSSVKLYRRQQITYSLVKEASLHRYMKSRRNRNSFFHVDGYSYVKNKFAKKYGNSFHFWKTNITSYPTINYGEPVRILQKPNLAHLPQLDFLTLMLTRPCDPFLRQVVRYNTRETQHENGFHIVFVLASSYNATCNEMIDTENKKYGDILQFNHPDGYHFITLSVFYAFQYVHNLHLPIKYIAKTDSDCVVNYGLLQRRIAALDVARQNELYMGRCWFNITYNFKRNFTKDYVPKALLRDRTFVPYFAAGGCYVISYHILPRLLLAIQHLPFIAHNEDMNVGKGMVMLGIPCMGDEEWWIARHGCDNKTECLKYVVMHPEVSKEEIIRFYTYLK